MRWVVSRIAPGCFDAFRVGYVAAMGVCLKVDRAHCVNEGQIRQVS